MGRKILICTIGGSPEPINASIDQHKPDEIVFICSEKDRVTGKPGSYSQIEGDTTDDLKRRLDNIPYTIRKVPADDLEKAVGEIQKCLRQRIDEHPEARIVADYTGGTKTMSSALVLATYNKEHVNLSLVTAPRTDQVKITSGGSVKQVGREALQASRVIEQSIQYWKHFSYSEAVRMLGDVRPENTVLNQKVRMMESLGKAFDAWDRFDHAESKEWLEPYRKYIPEGCLLSINTLTREQPHPATIPARLWDLWFNALRRASQGRFDDAVARIYRLLEWTAQWILQTRCELDTANIDPQKIPANISIPANRKGQRQAGLMKAWELIGHHLPDSEAGQFGRQKLEELQSQTSVRNQSILAHGYQPVGRKDWDTLERWFEGNFLELLERETGKTGLRPIPEQLPRKPDPKIRQFLQQ